MSRENIQTGETASTTGDNLDTSFIVDGHLAAVDYLPVDCHSENAQEHITGRIVDVSLPKETGPDNELIREHEFSAIDLDAAQGKYLFNFVRNRVHPNLDSEVLDTGKQTPHGTISAALIALEGTIGEEIPGVTSVDWQVIRGFTDDHGVNELPITFEYDTATETFSYIFGAPRQILQIIKAQLRENSVTPHNITHSNTLANLLESGLIQISADDEASRQSPTISKFADAALASRARTPDLTDYLQREVDLHEHLKSTDHPLGNDLAAQKEALLETMAYTLFIGDAIRKGTLLARIGLFVESDSSMTVVRQHIAHLSGAEISDARAIKSWDGVPFIETYDYSAQRAKHGLQSPPPILYGQPFSSQQDGAIAPGSIRVFSREEQRQQGYEGFSSIDELVDIMSHSTDYSAKPPMPVTSVLTFETDPNKAGMSAKPDQHLMLLDGFEAPGRVLDTLLNDFGTFSNIPALPNGPTLTEMLTDTTAERPDGSLRPHYALIETGSLANGYRKPGNNKNDRVICVTDRANGVSIHSPDRALPLKDQKNVVSDSDLRPVKKRKMTRSMHGHASFATVRTTTFTTRAVRIDGMQPAVNLALDHSSDTVFVRSNPVNGRKPVVEIAKHKGDL